LISRFVAQRFIKRGELERESWDLNYRAIDSHNFFTIPIFTLNLLRNWLWARRWLFICADRLLYHNFHINWYVYCIWSYSLLKKAC